MALPVTISNNDVSDQNSYHGPFIDSNGNVYTILRDSVASEDGNANALKATDPTNSFSEIDASNRPQLGFGTGQNELVSMWVSQDGDDLHVIAQEDVVGGVFYGRLITSQAASNPDTWADIDGAGDRDILIENTGSDRTAVAVTIAVRSDGDIVVVYQGDSDMLMGTEYERIDWNVSTDSGKTWAGPVSIDNGAGGGNKNWTGCVMVPGKDDRMHVFFKDTTNHDAYQRRINSDDSLETFPSSFDATAFTLRYIFGHGVSYDDGGTQRVRCPYADSSDKVSIAKCDSEDTPTMTEDVDVSDHTVQEQGGIATIVSLAVDTKNLQLLYSRDVENDLYRDTNDDDAGWGTDTEELDAVTVNHISSNVYDRSGTNRLAFIYDDGGTVKYNEIDLAAAVTDDLEPYWIASGQQQPIIEQTESVGY